MKMQIPFLLLFLFIASNAFSQDLRKYQYQKITDQNGLQSNEVYDIVEDQEGYIWIATDNGISRFNGLTHHVFNSKDGIKGNTGYHLFNQDDTSIVLVNNRGIFYKIKENVVTLLIPEDSLKKHIPSIEYPFSFMVDDNNNYRIGTRSCEYLFSENGFLINKRRQLFNSLNIERLNDTDLFCSFNFDLKERFDSIQIKLNNQLIYSFKVPNYYINSSYYPSATKDLVVIPFGHEIMVVNNNNRKVIKNVDARVISSYVLGDQVFVCTEKKGVICYTWSNGELINPYRLLDGLSVSSVLRDCRGNYWFSTLEDGVRYIDLLKPQSVFIAPITQNITSINFLEGGLYIGYQSGELVNDLGLKILKAQNKIFGVRIVGDRKLVLGRGLLEYKKESFTQLLKDHGGKNMGTKDIHFIEPEKILIQTSLKLLLWDSKKNEVLDQLAFNSKILDVLINKNDIYVTTENKILKYSFSDKLNYVHNYSVKDCQSLFLLNDKVYGLTKNYRIIQILENNISYGTYLYGPADNSLSCSYFNNGILHIGNSNGLYSWAISSDLNTNSLINYENIPFIQRISSLNDTLYFSTKKEVYKKAISHLKVRLPIIRKIVLNTGNKEYSNVNVVTLLHDFSNLQITLDVLSFSSNEVIYRYKIHNLNNEFQYVSEPSFAINNLASGEYSVEVSASIDGVNYTKSEFIEITVRPPFWVTWWFISLCSLFLITLVWLIIKVRLRKINEKHRIEEAIENLKSKALVAQLNPHMIFNVMNSIQGLVSEGQIEEANIFISRFSTFIRSSLNYSSVKTISLNAELELAQQYFDIEKIRFGDEISMDIKSKLNSSDNIEVPPLVLQPIIENAIKHGLLPSARQNKHLWLEIKKEGEVVIISINDDGVGVNLPFEYGIGTKLTEDRLKLLNQKNQLIIRRTKKTTSIELVLYNED